MVGYELCVVTSCKRLCPASYILVGEKFRFLFFCSQPAVPIFSSVEFFVVNTDLFVSYCLDRKLIVLLVRVRGADAR